MASQTVEQQAQILVQRLTKGSEDGNLGSATVAAYDTAWVSMVSKIDAGQQTWLFPECFRYLLDSQLPNGGWECYSSTDDSLLNTLAALLAMKKHMNACGLMSYPDLPDLEARISAARTYVQERLHSWAFEGNLHVGFEILIPALLSLLEKENIDFFFPKRQELETIKSQKLANFDLEMLYSTPTTSLHTLEAFIDQVDFDRLGCHTSFGSMMASPASTAAYLIRSSVWDTNAEIYLRRVIHEGSGKGSGGLPSVFPMPVFEISWILSTFIQSGFTTDELGTENIERLVIYLEEHLQNQHGILGFVPSVLADADDTAKTLLTLNLLGRAAMPDSMIDQFISESGSFRTYPGERDASLSANCNVLNALLYSLNVEVYGPCISSIATSLCNKWYSGATRDKWNTSPQYSMMLLAEALTQLLRIWDKGLLKNPDESLLRHRIPVVLAQILNQTLLTQNTSGAWGLEEWPETTAYSILTLMTLHSLPWHGPLQQTVFSAVQSGKAFLDRAQANWTKPAYVWIEKVTFGSSRLSESYCLAAMKTSETSHNWSNNMKGVIDIRERPVLKLVPFFSTLPILHNEPRWKLIASAVEAQAFLPRLKSVGKSLIPELKEAKNEYLAYIPFTWVMINNHNGLRLSAGLLWDMMFLTVCNFRVDEYMESAVARLSMQNLEPIMSLVDDLCNTETSNAHRTQPQFIDDQLRAVCSTETLDLKIEAGTNRTEMEAKHPQANTTRKPATDAHLMYPVSTLTSVRAVLGHYTRAMLTYPGMHNASRSDQSHLRKTLHNFLLSHIAQIVDNSKFATQSSCNTSATTVFSNAGQSFYNWVHTTGAESVSCPFSFAFLTCLLGGLSTPTRKGSLEPAKDCFGSTRQKYLAQEMCTHLAVMSRLYNDYGSVERDRIEANINSINFPDFHTNLDSVATSTNHAEHEQKLKERLLELAKLERQSADIALNALLGDLEGASEGGGRRTEKQKADAVKLFTGVTRLYADLYVARDLSNRIVNSPE